MPDRENGIRVALACSGVGRVQRGFERLAIDLHQLLRDDVDITLFKGGGGSGPGEKVLWNASRHGWFNSLVPLHALTDRSPYFVECMTYAAALAPHLLGGRYDIVHYIDLYLGKPLQIIRKLTGGRWRLLHTQGVQIHPRLYPPADHIHQIADGQLHDALEHGIPAHRMSLVPCGVHAARFAPSASRSALRERFGVPPGETVVLSISAINRVQKRIDYVIEEVARAARPCMLWLDGQAEDPSLVALARSRLGSRCRVTRVPTETVPDLYAMADVFVLGSIQESFGIAIVEAMCSGLPVITHDAPHFQWLVGDDTALVDVRRPGALAERLGELLDAPGLRKELGVRNQQAARARFDWSMLRTSYLDMYRRVLQDVPRAT